MAIEIGDTLYLQTFDGLQLFVPSDETKFIVYGNFGAPPVEFITRRGYRQHGSTEVDYLLTSRIIAVHLWRSPACSRQEYWDNRLALHEFLRHNRGGDLTFVLQQPNGTKRALNVRANPGLVLPPPAVDDNNWDVDELIEFIAFDPVWYDPDTPSVFVTSEVSLNLVFPITFPILFGSSGIISPNTITYRGTWVSYPTLTLFGPYTSAIIENVTTGVEIFMNVSIAGGERRVIDLTPGSQSVVDGFGVNRFGELGPGSNLVDWNLRPDPEVPGGVQTVQATFLGGTAGTTAFQVDYKERYFAL